MKSSNIKMGTLSRIVVALIVFAAPISHATAACIDGLPCVVDKEVNDPLDPADGPNLVGANRDKSESDICDADFMNQIYSRAYLEAERETVVGEIFIRKPDSVMEYTCFDQQVGLAGTRASSLFSNTTISNTVNVRSGISTLSPIASIMVNIGANNMSEILRDLVSNGLQEYRNTNFQHPFLGGYISVENSTIDTSAAASSYSCDVMNTIWFGAKCANIGADEEFFTFEFLSTASDDPRQLPQACNPFGTTITADMEKVANNETFQYVNFDETELFLDRMEATTSCLAAIPTGIRIIQTELSKDIQGNVNAGTVLDYLEHVCTNPACNYNQTSSTCEPSF